MRCFGWYVRSRGYVRGALARCTPYSFGWVILSAMPCRWLVRNFGDACLSPHGLVLKAICQQGLARLPPLYMRRSWRNVSHFTFFPRLSAPHVLNHEMCPSRSTCLTTVRSSCGPAVKRGTSTACLSCQRALAPTQCPVRCSCRCCLHDDRAASWSKRPYKKQLEVKVSQPHERRDNMQAFACSPVRCG